MVVVRCGYTCLRNVGFVCLRVAWEDNAPVTRSDTGYAYITQQAIQWNTTLLFGKRIITGYITFLRVLLAWRQIIYLLLAWILEVDLR